LPFDRKRFHRRSSVIETFPSPEARRMESSMRSNGSKSVAEGREGEAGSGSKGNTAGGLWFTGGFPSGTRTRKHRSDPVPATTLALDRSTSTEKLVYLGKRVTRARARLYLDQRTDVCTRAVVPVVTYPAPFSPRPVGI